MVEFLSRLRDLLQEQCRIPDLPPGWTCSSAMLAAHGFEYGGDFFVAGLAPSPDGGRRLAMVLVDVCGKGATAVPDAVRLAVVLRKLMADVPVEEVMVAANTDLLAQPAETSIATAVQVIIDLDTGSYTIRSAGHPPALHWSSAARAWVVDNARGTALGVVAEPEFDVSEGVLAPGEALLFYTDGVVESRVADIEAGIDWLRAVAAAAVETDGFAAVPGLVMERLERGDDDRAVLVLARE